MRRRGRGPIAGPLGLFKSGELSGTGRVRLLFSLCCSVPCVPSARPRSFFFLPYVRSDCGFFIGLFALLCAMIWFVFAGCFGLVCAAGGAGPALGLSCVCGLSSQAVRRTYY